MAHFITSGDNKYPDLAYDDDYRSYLITQRNFPRDYRFGRTHGKYARIYTRVVVNRLNGYFKSLINVIAKAKMRRIERELLLRGIRYDRSRDNWTMHTPSDRPTARED